MNGILMNPLTFLCYSFLFLSVIALWLPFTKKHFYWLGLLVIASIVGLANNRLNGFAIIILIVLGSAFYSTQAKKIPITLRITSGIIALLLSVGLMNHKIPGFYNLKILNHVFISQDAIPYSLYLNFDKTVVGIFIIGLTYQVINTRKDWLLMLKQMFPVTLLTLFIVSLLALLLKVIHLDVKFPSVWWIWCITNLLSSCVAEEAFFRGFIQKNLASSFAQIKFGDYLAILLTALLFGIIHYMNGPKYFLLATLAGLGYGYAYHRTKRLEASILTHFILNSVQFFFFTYPMLKP